MRTNNNQLAFIMNPALTTGEFHSLDLAEETLDRLRQVIRNEERGDLSALDLAELEIFQEVAFLMRQGDDAQ